MLNKLRKSIGLDSENPSKKSIFKKRKQKEVSFTAVPQIAENQSQPYFFQKRATDQAKHVDRLTRRVKSTGAIHNFTSYSRKLDDLEPISVIQKDYAVNPRIQTTYQHHYNNAADLRLGYCDNRSIEERHRYFKERRKLQADAIQTHKSNYASNYHKYNNTRQGLTEYMAETSYVGATILKSGIHNHLKCPSRGCTHFITFK